MISFEKAKQGKRLMKQFIADGELEKAAFIGLMYQVPIRVVDAVTVRGKVILQPHGKEFFTWYSKHLFTLHGKHFFT